MQHRNEPHDDDGFTPFDPKHLMLRFAIWDAIHDLDEPHREVLEPVFSTMEQKKPLVLQEIADGLQMNYGTFYPRLEKALYLLAIRLKANPNIQDWFPGAACHTPDPDYKRVTRLVK